MSNKTEIQSLNAKYSELIESLRGKAVGGGGNGDLTFETIPLTVTNEGMYEPGVNKYVFSGQGLNVSTRRIVIIQPNYSNICGQLFLRTSLTDDFTEFIGNRLHDSGTTRFGVASLNMNPFTGENEITLYGTLVISDNTSYYAMLG